MIKTGNRNFWIAQVLGWGTFAGMNLFVQYLSLRGTEELADNLVWLIVNSSVAFLGGLVLTTIYRYYLKSRTLNLLNFRKTLKYIVVGTLVLTSSFLGFVALLLLVLHDGRMITLLELFGNFFIFGVLLLIWNSIYFMIHYLHSWKNAEAEKWQLEASVKAAELGSLKAQINPHFVFNAINNIRALISEDGERARDMLLNFSDMFRYSLVHNDQSMVTIAEEVEVVEKYLELLSIQYEERLSYEINVEEGLEEERIPPMILHLLVENAVKHGIARLAEGGYVKVNVAFVADELLLEVINSGEISEQNSIEGKLGVGLQNIKERLRLIYDDSERFTLRQVDDEVIAEVRIPRKNIVA